jgi:flagella synthesis protein FlgN
MTNQLPPLLPLLQQQQEHLSVLLALLETERTTLATNQFDLFEQNTEAKLECLQTIRQLDDEIASHATLQQVKTADWFVKEVQAIDNILAQCKELTAINQQILEQSQLRVDALKYQLLQGSGKSGLTYNAKGKPALDSIGKGIKA